MSALHDRARFFCILHFAFCIAVASCASLPKPITLPSDAGTPFADFAAVHTQLSSACSGVRTLTMEIGLSGRAGDEPLRGRVIAGFERPSSMHLQGVAPFGGPVFLLWARDGSASLLLTREERIVRNAAPEAILGALTGVALNPADLQAVFTGCVVPASSHSSRTKKGWIPDQVGDDEVGEGRGLWRDRVSTSGHRPEVYPELDEGLDTNGGRVFDTNRGWMPDANVGVRFETHGVGLATHGVRQATR